MLVPMVVFWGSNLLFLLVDITWTPSFITLYKIQVDKNTPVRCIYPSILDMVRSIYPTTLHPGHGMVNLPHTPSSWTWYGPFTPHPFTLDMVWSIKHTTHNMVYLPPTLHIVQSINPHSAHSMVHLTTPYAEHVQHFELYN